MSDTFYTESQTEHSSAPRPNRGVVMNFFDFTEPQLSAMASDLSLAMTSAELALCQAYFATPERRFPTLDEIYFLDALVRHCQQFADACRIGRTNAGHAHLSATREDFLQKLHAVDPRLSRPVLLSEAADVAARYLDRIGAGKELTRTATTGSTEATRLPIPDGVSLLLLLPMTEGTAYEEALAHFLSDPVNTVKLLRTGTVSEYGLAVTLAHETCGIHLDLSALGNEDTSEPALSCLINGHVGRRWIAARREIVELLVETAATHGLSAVCFGRATATGKLTLAKGKHSYIAPDLGLLRTLAASAFDADCYLSADDDRHAPFFGAMYDALTTALLGCAEGNTRKELALAVSYQFPRLAITPNICGADLEAILGTYRVLIELCVTAASSVTFVSEAQTPSWQIDVHEPLRTRPNHRVRADSRVYLLPVEVNVDGMPDFVKYRMLCDTLARLANEGKILAVAKSNTTVWKNENLPLAVRALLIESTESLPFAVVAPVEGESFFTVPEEKASEESTEAENF